MFKGVEKEQLKVPAHIDYLGDLRDFVTQIGKKHGFSDKMINAFKLAIDEAATNIIRHAYRDTDGLITIRAIVKKSSLTIALIDQGTFFDPKRVKDPDLKRYIDIGKKGGLGIFIMRKLMDEIDYRKTEEGNELRITKHREPAEKKKILSAVSSIPLSLKAKYFFRTIAVITVVIVLGYLYFFIKTDDDIIAQFISSGRSISHQIANRIGSNVTTDMTFIDDVVHPIYDDYKDRVLNLLIEDKTGSIGYTAIVRENALEFKRPADSKHLDVGLYQYTEDGETVYEFEVPIIIKASNIAYGKAHVLFSTDSVYKEIRSMRLNDLKLALLILGLSYVGVAILIYIVMIPFRKLSDWVQTMGHGGDIEDEMDIDASTEIGEIAQAFSDITHKFRESQKNLADQERLQKEMQVAQEIQQTLLPMEFPELEGYELASYYEAAKEVGGDYYDFVEVDKDTLGIAVADVSGKGVPGSLVMTMIRTALRTEARGVKDAAEVLARVNDFVSNDMKKGMFVTIFYLIIDSKKRRLNYASAGHNPMILYRGSTQKTYYLNPKGFPIGIQLPQKDLFRNYIQSDTIQLAEDDILIVYTDGITEAMNRERDLFGEERLLKTMRGYGNLPVVPFVEELKNSIHSFTEGSPQYDDITLVAIREKTSREKDELRRAKEAHRLISDGQSIREACESVGITTYAYYNKYKRTFEEEGIESFEIDEEVSVEAKHLSIEEKTKILDIIANHPEYGAGRISDELNTEKYGFTQITENKIYDELVRSRLNTRQLREAYVAKSKRDRRRLKPPGTPLLTLDGNIILDRQEEAPVPLKDDKIQSRIVKQKEKEEERGVEEEIGEPERREPEDVDVSSDFQDRETPPQKPKDPDDADIEADFLIGTSIEELLSKENETDPPELDRTKQDQTEDFVFNESDNNIKGNEQDTDFIDEFTQENESEAEEDFSFEELADDRPFDDHAARYESLQLPEDQEHARLDEREPAEKDDDLGSEDIDLDFLNEDEEDQADLLKFDADGAQDLTISSIDELLAEDQNEVEASDDLEPTDEQLASSENNEEADDEDDSFADLIQTIEEDVVYLSEEGDEEDSNNLYAAGDELEDEIRPNIGQGVENKNGREQEHESTTSADGDGEADDKEQILISGIRHYKNKDYENAIREFQRVIEQYPDFKEAHSILGNAYFRNKMYAQAEQAYQRVKEMDPNDVTAYENMGVIYANRGQFQDAIEQWKTVLELNPDRSDIVQKIEKAKQMIDLTE